MSGARIRILQVVPKIQQEDLENFIMSLYRNVDRNQVQFDFLEHYSDDQFFDDEIRSSGGLIYRIPYMEHEDRFFDYRIDLNWFFNEHREFSLVHGHMGSTPLFYLQAAQKWGVANWIIHAHESSYIRSVRGYVRKALIRQSWQHATQLLACSGSAGRYHFNDRSFHIVCKAIGVQRFRFDMDTRIRIRRSPQIDEQTLLLCHVWRFAAEKNRAYLVDVLEAVKKLVTSVMLVMIGEGETTADIQARVAQSHLEENVRFVEVSANPEWYYSASDVFLLPSLYERLPLTGVEAQCNGLPIIFSEKVPSDVFISSSVHYCLINGLASGRAGEIVKDWDRGLLNRALGTKAVQAAGFDVRETAKRMQGLLPASCLWRQGDQGGRAMLLLVCHNLLLSIRGRCTARSFCFRAPSTAWG